SATAPSRWTTPARCRSRPTTSSWTQKPSRSRDRPPSRRWAARSTARRRARTRSKVHWSRSTRGPGRSSVMPLGAFFEDQLADIRAFLDDPDRVVRIVEVDPELRPVLLRMLAGLDDEDEFPHLLIGHDGRFSDPVQWFTDLQNALETELGQHAAELGAEG